MTKMPNRHDPVLCFVRLPWVWFSFVECDSPTLAGDMWDETYEGDAGNPAWPSEVLRVAISPGRLLTPDLLDRAPNTPGPSPLEINASGGGWLFATDSSVVARAGTPLSEFREVMRERGVELYEPAWSGRPAFSPIEPGLGEPRISLPDEDDEPSAGDVEADVAMAAGR